MLTDEQEFQAANAALTAALEAATRFMADRLHRFASYDKDEARQIVQRAEAVLQSDDSAREWLADARAVAKALASALARFDTNDWNGRYRLGMQLAFPTRPTVEQTVEMVDEWLGNLRDALTRARARDWLEA